MRQWVLPLPKRLRYFLQREPAAVNAVLPIFLRIVEQTLRAHSPGAGPRARPKPRAKTPQSRYLRKSRSMNAETVFSQASPAHLSASQVSK